jgi:hypothetical protein
MMVVIAVAAALGKIAHERADVGVGAGSGSHAAQERTR